MDGRDGAKHDGPPSDDEIRARISSEIRIPQGMTQHGADAFAEEAVNQVDDLTDEVILKAVELHSKRLPTELTEESVLSAVENMKEKQRNRILSAAAKLTSSEQGALTQAQQAARQLSRRRRRIGAGLGLLATVIASVAALAGPMAPLVASVAVLVAVASVALTLTSGE